VLTFSKRQQKSLLQNFFYISLFTEPTLSLQIFILNFILVYSACLTLMLENSNDKAVGRLAAYYVGIRRRRLYFRSARGNDGSIVIGIFRNLLTR